MSNRRDRLKQILHGTIWVSIYTGLFRLLTLLVAIMSARMLDVEDYGKVSIMQSTSALFIMFATMGLGTVATKLVAEANGKYVNIISWINTSLCFLAAVAIFLWAEFIAADIYQDPSLHPLLQVLSLYIFFCGVTQIQSGVLAGKEDYSTIAKINLVFGLASLVVVFVMIKQFGVFGWLYGLTALEIAKALAFKIAINKRFDDLNNSVEKDDIVYVSKLAIPIALSGFFVLPVNWYLTKELLIRAGYLDVATLNISDQWIAIMTFFPIAIGNAMLPILSKMGQGDERKSMSDLALKLNVVLALAIGIPVLFLGEFILGFYGQSYVQNSEIFFYTLPLVVVLSLTNQLNNRVIADGRPALMMYSNLLWLAICLPVSVYALGLELGVIALLIGRLVAYICKFIFLYTFTRRNLTA